MTLTVNVTLKRIMIAVDPYIVAIQSTYISSFPEIERRDFSLFCELLRNEPDFSLFAILKEDRYVGFVTCWDFTDFIYVEHFAIDESQRGGGIGSVAMKECLSLFKRKVVLEVEEVVDELTRRRVRFYEDLGFVLHRQSYQQPPYRPGTSWLDMKLMSYGEFDMDRQFELVKERLYRNVYKLKKTDQPDA